MTNIGHDSQPLLQPVRLGALTLANRLVMAPLTRNRSAAGYIPWDLNALYYAQRASAGLIVSEATAINPFGHGGANTPGLYTPEQIEGWRLVTSAVHGKGGRIFAQLWHTGRQAPAETIPTGSERQTTLNLTKQGIALITAEYAQAARNAIAAGFDGVEIHGANGYLPDQFLEDGTNARSDDYGGSIEHRARFLLDATRAAISAVGADRVGVRLSPGGTFGDISDSMPWETFSYAVRELDKLALAYIHLVEPRNDRGEPAELATARFRPLISRPTQLIVAGGYDRASGNAAIAEGTADLVAFGRLFISNPDLPARFAREASLTAYDRSTFYGGGAAGYVDYPTLQAG
ncbi:MAG: alkene reductase [Acidobacteria bacterium]|nr:alkene reductase [Acidobacteriota bacterium]